MGRSCVSVLTTPHILASWHGFKGHFLHLSARVWGRPLCGSREGPESTPKALTLQLKSLKPREGVPISTSNSTEAAMLACVKSWPCAKDSETANAISPPSGGGGLGERISHQSSLIGID